jgi:hypothetical protein
LVVAPVVLERLDSLGQDLSGSMRGPATSRRRIMSAFLRCVSPSSSSSTDTPARRRYMSSTFRTAAGDQKRSAMAAVRGQMRESMVSGVTSSVHMVASPPRMKVFWKSLRGESAGRGSLR